MKDPSIAAASALLMLGFMIPAAAQTTSQSPAVYRVETIAPARVKGDVIAAKVRWSCAGSSCTTTAPAGLNQTEMCRDLARQVGPLKSYLVGESSLDAAQLEQCNGNLAGVAVQAVRPAVVAGKQTLTAARMQPVPASPAVSRAPALASANAVRPLDDARFAPISNALAATVRSSVPNLDEFLAASRRYVEMPASQRNSAYVESVNSRFAGPIRAALTKAVGVPNLGELLQSVQKSGAACSSDNAPGQVAACCSAQQLTPPFDGLFREGDLGAREVVPGPVSQLAAEVRGWGIAAPHVMERSGLRVTVPDADHHERVTVTLDTEWVLGLSGLGYAHVWLGLDMQVSKSGGAVACSAPHLEQDNQWTWAGGYLTISDHRPGPRITRTCEFDRNPGDGTDYVVNVSSAANGTFVGTSGGYGDYFVKLGPVDVTSCP